jgi:two-component system chemotaxis response regulator CheY
MKHCLVVDDSGSIRKVARRILESTGFRTDEAETREEALAKCREEMPDCVIVDW